MASRISGCGERSSLFYRQTGRREPVADMLRPTSGRVPGLKPPCAIGYSHGA